MSDAHKTQLDRDARELARSLLLRMNRGGRLVWDDDGVRQLLYAALLSTHKQARESALRQAAINCTTVSHEFLSTRHVEAANALRGLSEHFHAEADKEVKP